MQTFLMLHQKNFILRTLFVVDGLLRFQQTEKTPYLGQCRTALSTTNQH